MKRFLFRRTPFKRVKQTEVIRTLLERVRSAYLALQKNHYTAALLARAEIERLKLLHEDRLLAHGFQAFSQNDEDGMIQEIFRRIGAGSRTFIEIGCGEGLENNTLYLLLSGWSGMWIDADEGNVRSCESLHRQTIRDGSLKLLHRAVTVENVEETLSERDEPDLMSVDIDGNDYWVWKALTSLRPRVLVIEYNATFRPPVNLVQRYEPGATWDGTNYYGASLAAVEDLGISKGYLLIGCDLSGNNAFFVREDCLADHFTGPFTSAAQYMPPRYDLFALVKERQRFIWNVHPPGIGDY